MIDSYHTLAKLGKISNNYCVVSSIGLSVKIGKGDTDSFSEKRIIKNGFQFQLRITNTQRLVTNLHIYFITDR